MGISSFTVHYFYAGHQSMISFRIGSPMKSVEMNVFTRRDELVALLQRRFLHVRRRRDGDATATRRRRRRDDDGVDGVDDSVDHSSDNGYNGNDEAGDTMQQRCRLKQRYADAGLSANTVSERDLVPIPSARSC
jgi:hypothetical protein